MIPRAIILVAVTAVLSIGASAQEQSIKQKGTTQETAEQENASRAPEPGTDPKRKAQFERTPVNADQREPTRVQATTGDIALPPAKWVEGTIKNYKCPAELLLPSGTTFTSQPGLKFVRANAYPGGCQNDLSPEGERGGFCMSCFFEASLVIRRSSGPNTKCWVSQSEKDEFSCEYVPPPPPSQTCNFKIKLPIVNLMPYTQHTKGDKDLHSHANILGVNYVDMKIDAEIQRGIGPQSNALFLVLSAVHAEGGGDQTTFKKDYAIKLGDEHYLDATAVDVANCLASYGSQRPLTILPKGEIGQRSLEGHDWRILETWKGESNLIEKAECRFDTKYSDDMKRVGCRKIWFKQDVTARLK